MSLTIQYLNVVIDDSDTSLRRWLDQRQRRPRPVARPEPERAPSGAIPLGPIIHDAEVM